MVEALHRVEVGGARGVAPARGALPAPTTSSSRSTRSTTRSSSRSRSTSCSATASSRCGVRRASLVIAMADPSDLFVVDELKRSCGPRSGSRSRPVGDRVGAAQGDATRRVYQEATEGFRLAHQGDRPGRGDPRPRPPDRRLGDVADHQARRHHDLRRLERRALGHPHRDARQRGHGQVPHRRRALRGGRGDRHPAPPDDHLGIKVMSGSTSPSGVPQGRPLPHADQGAESRLPRLDPPSVHGEDAVIRILDKEQINESFRDLRLDVVGFDPAPLLRFGASSSSPTAWSSHRPDRLGQDDDAYAASSESATTRTRSSPSRTRSSTSLAG